MILFIPRGATASQHSAGVGWGVPTEAVLGTATAPTALRWVQRAGRLRGCCVEAHCIVSGRGSLADASTACAPAAPMHVRMAEQVGEQAPEALAMPSEPTPTSPCSAF